MEVYGLGVIGEEGPGRRGSTPRTNEEDLTGP